MSLVGKTLEFCTHGMRRGVGRVVCIDERETYPVLIHWWDKHGMHHERFKLEEFSSYTVIN